MAKIEVTCISCDRREKFVDNKDITYSGWYIVGWNVITAGAIVICDKCPAPFWIRTAERSHTKNPKKDVDDIPADKPEKVSKKKKVKEKQKKVAENPFFTES